MQKRDRLYPHSLPRGAQHGQTPSDNQTLSIIIHLDVHLTKSNWDIVAIDDKVEHPIQNQLAFFEDQRPDNFDGSMLLGNSNVANGGPCHFSSLDLMQKAVIHSER
jgi:hypothetical protein